MKINFYLWKDTDTATKEKILRRSEADIENIEKAVRPIIDNVRLNGDQALYDYARKFEKAELKTIKATDEEFEQARKNLPGDLQSAIRHCADNVRRFHEEQMNRIERRWMVEVEPGVWAGEQVTAIPSVGLYVPRGKGAFPSAMYMLCIPAIIAGVSEVAVVTPPTPEGKADDASLFTAELCGVENVYKVGGAQAIAALAYGTETVPKVSKVLGPGSPYVAAAKRVLSNVIDPGMPAGPSESIVLCDASADPDNTVLDILNEAEHGEDSAGILITHDETLARAVLEKLPAAINALPEPHRSICEKVMGDYGAVILTESLDKSVELANLYAAEHLVLKVENPHNIVPRLYHAGEILIGETSPSTLANFGIGVNHVLPTGGHARTHSATGIWDFLKRSSLAYVDKDGLDSIKTDVCKVAFYEGFPAHVNAVMQRKIKNTDEEIDPQSFAA